MSVHLVVQLEKYFQLYKTQLNDSFYRREINGMLVEIFSAISIHQRTLRAIWNKVNKIMGISVESTEWIFSPLFPGRIEIWKCWFLWKEENWSTRRKTLGAGTRTSNKFTSPEIEPGPQWWEASALTTASSLRPYVFITENCHRSRRVGKMMKLI